MAQISAADFNLREQLELLTAAIDKLNAATEKSTQTIIAAREKSSNKQIKAEETSTEKQIKAEEKSAKEIEDLKAKEQEERDKKTKDTWASIGQTAEGIANSITGQFRSMLVQYTEEQQKLQFNLLGSGMTYDTVRNALSVLGSNSFIQQRQVYQHLTELVSSGITMNAAQRAFLQTASDQVNLGFRTNEASLNRLIQLQQMDLSEARMAQMAGLRTFLEQNYQNSQYIKDGFSQVSASLLEMQSMMSAQVAMSTEKTIQTYLGSFQSAGGNVGGSIATALNAIGSGNFEYGDGMQNLMIMAASRAGLSYADLLTGGLDAAKSEQLMQSLFSYIAEMSNIGGGSNVAINAMAKIFGLNVSDIKAAQNMDLSRINPNNVNSDISSFLNDFASSTNDSTRMSIMWQNALSNQALTTPLGLVGFDLVTGLSDLVGNALQSAGEAQGLLGGQAISLIGSGIKAAPALGILLSALTDDASTGFKDLFSVNNLKNFKNGGTDSFVAGLLSMLGGSQTGLYNDYFSLGGLDNSISGAWDVEGNFYERGKGTDVGAYASNTQRELTTLNISNTEEQEYKTLDDLYNLLADDFPTTTWATVTNIASANNSVLLGDAHTTQYITDMITLTAVSTENILMLLENYFAGANRTLIDMSALGLENSWGDWSGGGRR